ncbi:MAG: hypothetical protein QOJ29_2782 [Thermoleophilaceae bacterium]|jgi:hypothetical protein|nr:hypothetical protein [Thermoleophilaceae bacterium]
MPFGFGKKDAKPPKRDPADKQKYAGAREYEARRQDRLAARRESSGDIDGARIAREAAAEARRTPRRDS